MNAFTRIRKMSNISISDTSSSTSGSSGGSSTRSNSFVSTPVTPPSSTNGHSDSLPTIHTITSSSPPPPTNSTTRSSTSTRNFSRHITCPSPTVPTGPVSPTTITSPDTSALLMSLQLPSTIDPSTLCDLPASTPFMSDIFSLACIFLDILTFALKGKNLDFIKFRSSRVTVFPLTSQAGGGGGRSAISATKTRIDSSFHSSPDQIAAWIDILEEDSYRHAERVYRGIPSVLRLIRTMLAQNATLRPTALEVRDRMQEVLVGECGVEGLCCKGREWVEVEGEAEDEKNRKDDCRGSGDTGYKSPLRRRDIMGLEEDDLRISKEVEGTDGRCRTSCGEETGGGRKIEVEVEMEMEMERLSMASSMAATKGRRGSSASSATARPSTWRRFMRH